MSFVERSNSALTITAATAAAWRDKVQIVGSCTVLPYASIVAEASGENFVFPKTVVDSGSSSAGLKRFCEGIGENTIDIANAFETWDQVNPDFLAQPIAAYILASKHGTCEVSEEM